MEADGVDFSNENYDDFLSLPTIGDLESVGSCFDDKEHTIRRLKPGVPYKNAASRFLTKRVFDTQYKDIYAHRLEKMKPYMDEAARRKWGSAAPNKVLRRVLDARPGTPAVVCGTIYKEMPLVQRVLDEYIKERSVGPLPPRDSYVSDKDALILEDEEGRVPLVGNNLPIKDLVTGVTIAVKGITMENGDFQVEDFCTAGIPPLAAIPRAVETPTRYALLVSGLRVGDPRQNPLAAQMLVDLVAGQLGSLGEEQHVAARIVHVIIAGNSIFNDSRVSQNASNISVKRMTDKQKADLMAPVKELDILLAQLAAAVPVDLMPGEIDPANYMLPQQPFARCLLPTAQEYASFNCVPNPHEAEIDGRIFLGTAGQTINNIERYLTIGSKLELMERTLEWRHIAPTAPDQLHCYPYYDADPFVLERSPHVYFAGDQKEFQTKTVTIPGTTDTVRLVTLPPFATTGLAALVDLNTLDVRPLVFNCEL